MACYCLQEWCSKRHAILSTNNIHTLGQIAPAVPVLLVVALASLLAGCTVPMGTLRPGPVVSIDRTAIPVRDASSLYRLRDDWLRFDFDSDMDYARLIRRRELNVSVRMHWCGKEVPRRWLTSSPLFGEDGKVNNASQLLPVSDSRAGGSTVYTYHAYVRIDVPGGPAMPPGSPEQGGDYDLRHPVDDLCLSVGGGDMVGNHGESTILVYPVDVVGTAARGGHQR